MTDITRIDDHTEQALERLIEAYSGLPRLSGLVASITKRLQEFEDINWAVVNKRLLDYTGEDGLPAHAIAAQLDTIGRLVGRGRNGQDDATYLIYIRAQIFLNKSRALRGDIVTLLKLIESAPFTYREFYPATVLIEFLTPPSASPNVLVDLAKRAVSGGVRLFLEAPTTDDAHAFECGLVGEADGTGDQGFSDSVSGAYGGELASVYT